MNDLHKQPYELWAILASHAIGEMFDACRALTDMNYTGLDRMVRFVSTQLLIACHLTSESVLILVQGGKEWDADILARSVAEGTLKYVFMLEGVDRLLWRDRCIEYWELHPDLMMKRDCRNAKTVVDLKTEETTNTHSCIDPIQELFENGQKLSDLWQKTNKQIRKTLDSKWSVSGILKHFSSLEDKRYSTLNGLCHNYGMSSHVAHMDGIGTGMIWERYRRDTHRGVAVKVAHSARLISDVLALALLRYSHLSLVCNEDAGPVRTIYKKYDSLNQELKSAYIAFHAAEYSRG